MKNVLHKALLVSLVGVAAAGVLAGCGKTSTDGVTIRIPVYDRGGAVDVTNNYWTKYVQENFGDPNGITVEYVAIPRGDVLNAYANLANSGQLPTILMEYDFPKQAQWADDGYLAEIDLKDFKKAAPTYYKMMEDNGLLNFTDLNGKTYFALAERPYWNNTYNYVTFYRADWLEKLGVNYPSTYAETKELYKKLKEGGYCEYPAGGSKIAGAGVDQNYGFRTRPQDELEWATTGDYAIPALSTEATKKLIKRQNELYNLGYLNPEFYTREATDNEADFVAGKSFSYSAYIAPNIAVLTSFYENNPDAKLAIAYTDGLVVDEDGVSNAYRPNNQFGMMIGFSATASKAEIEAAWKYMEWFIQPDNLFTMQYGIEGQTFEYKDGIPSITNNSEGEYAMANNNKDYYCVCIESYNIDNIDDLIKVNAPSGYKDSADFVTQIKKNYEGMVKLAEAEGGIYIQSDCNFATVINAVTEKQQNLLDKYSEFRTKLTTCKPEEFDALYEDYKKQYLEAGYQAIIDERKAAYENGLTSKLPK